MPATYTLPPATTTSRPSSSCEVEKTLEASWFPEAASNLETKRSRVEVLPVTYNLLPENVTEFAASPPPVTLNSFAHATEKSEVLTASRWAALVENPAMYRVDQSELMERPNGKSVMSMS